MKKVTVVAGGSEVPGQPRLHSESLFKNKTKKTRKESEYIKAEKVTWETDLVFDYVKLKPN